MKKFLTFLPMLLLATPILSQELTCTDKKLCFGYYSVFEVIDSTFPNQRQTQELVAKKYMDFTRNGCVSVCDLTEICKLGGLNGESDRCKQFIKDLYNTAPTVVSKSADGVTVKLTSSCRDEGSFVKYDLKQYMPNTKRGIHCWCKVISPQESQWIYVDTLLDCRAKCSGLCADPNVQMIGLKPGNKLQPVPINQDSGTD